MSERKKADNYSYFDSEVIKTNITKSIQRGEYKFQQKEIKIMILTNINVKHSP